MLLQPTADETSTLTTIAAASLKVGATLCANVYDSEASPAMRIAAQDRWTYQWLASDSKEASDSEFQPIEGATSASFIITDELATKLAGKYIRVRIEGDDQTLYGPSGSFYTPSSTSYDTPGPVVAPGQIKLDYILLSWNGGGFGNDLESVPNCNVGDVLEACAYDFDDPYTLYGEDDAEFSWQVGDTKYGDFEEVSQGATYTAPEELSGRYLKVVATAKNGIPGSATCETEPGKVLPKGVSNLYRADIVNASASKEIGCTLQAQAYKGDYWSESPVNSGVTYTWRWSSEKPGYGFDESKWNVVEGATGPTFMVPDCLEGCWVSVTACAGDNTVSSANSSAAGPFRKPGTHQLYYAALDQTPEDDNFTFWSGRTIGVVARDTSAAGTAGDYLSPDDLAYTWYIADSYDGEYAELADENVHKASFVIPESYVGKHLKCVVSAGFNAMEAGPMRKAIAQGEAIGPVDPTPPDPVEPVSATVSARIVGVTPHAAGESYEAIDWVALRECAVADVSKTKAWDVFAGLLDEAGCFYSLDGGCPYSITTPDFTQTLAMSASAPWSYWSFLVNGSLADCLPSGYTLHDGDTIELRYVDATGIQRPGGDVTVDPSAPLGTDEADWAGFAGAGSGSLAADNTPTGATETAWVYDFREGDGDTSWSEPVMVGGRIYIAAGAELRAIDSATGKVLARTQLAGAVAYGARPVYVGGKVVVPLAGGRLQAVSTANMATVWLTDALPDGSIPGVDGAADVASSQQALSTLTVKDGYIYTGTAVADWQSTYGGFFVCVNADNGAVRWSVQNATAGYYWAGAAFLGDHVLFAGDDGVVRAIPEGSSDGKATNTLSLGVAARSTIASDGNFAYVATVDGVLHKVAVSPDGTLSKVDSTSFASKSTSSPTLSGGKAYVGGATADGRGVLAVVDLETMKVSTVSHADGKPLPAEVKSTPLVSVQNGTAHVYFTCNGAEGQWPNYVSGGGVYCYRDGNAEAMSIYDPPFGLANWCMASVVSGSDGRLYYVNDSGHLFALKAKESVSGAGQANGGEGAGLPGEASKRAALLMAGHPGLKASLRGVALQQNDALMPSALDDATAQVHDVVVPDVPVPLAEAVPESDSQAPWAVAGTGIGALGLAFALWLLLGRRDGGERERKAA